MQCQKLLEMDLYGTVKSFAVKTCVCVTVDLRDIKKLSGVEKMLQECSNNGEGDSRINTCLAKSPKSL